MSTLICPEIQDEIFKGRVERDVLQAYTENNTIRLRLWSKRNHPGVATRSLCERPSIVIVDDPRCLSRQRRVIWPGRPYVDQGKYFVRGQLVAEAAPATWRNSQ